MATFSLSPALIAPGRAAKVSVLLQESGANYVRLWVTNAPPGSELRGKLDKSRQLRIPVFESDGGTANPWAVTFDVGGRYTFVAQEYIRGASGHGGGYQFDPGAAPQETKVGNEYTLTLDIGQRLTMPVGTGADTATLVLWVWNDRIRLTTLDTQGEASPAIVAASPTPKMQVAMESFAVRLTLAALAGLPASDGVLVSSAVGDIDAIVADMVENINAHHAVASNVHNFADAVNIIPESFAATQAPRDLPAFVNATLKTLRQHRENSDGSGIDSVVIHNPPASAKKADFVNMPIVDAVGSLAEAYAALAEIYRCHQGHVPTEADGLFNEWHGPPDPAGSVPYFGLNDLPLLLQLHWRVFQVLASFNSTTPATQTTGAMLLIEQAGAVEG